MTTVPRYLNVTDGLQTDGWLTAAIPHNAHSARAAKSHNITDTKCLGLQDQLILWFLMVFTTHLAQGLGSWNVSSRTLNVAVSSRTKCATSRSRLGLGPMRLGSRLGLSLKGLVRIPDKESWKIIQDPRKNHQCNTAAIWRIIVNYCYCTEDALWGWKVGAK